ncbi:MAG: efflux RND transporter periplasmic adaptor subunit [Candidatus Zixiibacteriota bacterium]
MIIKRQLIGYGFYLLILAYAVLIFTGCSGGSSKSKNGRDKLIPSLEAVQAKSGSLPLVERLTGVVKAKNQVEIYSEINAVIKTVYVQNGDEVSQGQAIVSLRDTEYQERLNQARAAYQIAQAQARQAEAKLKEIESELRRTRSLAEKSLTSQAALESIETQTVMAEADAELARARIEQAQANVAEQEENLSKTVIRAPVAGSVGNRNAEIGMTVSPGTHLFTLGQLDSVKVEVILTDQMLDYIETGQRAEIQTSSLPLGLATAYLSRISPFLHPIAHSTDAEIDMVNKNHSLKSGMFVTVDIYYGESEQATLIPLSAIYENPLTGATGVYICRDTLNLIPVEPLNAGETGSLTEAVPFEFIPIDVIAKGRMSAGVGNIEPGSWVVTIGQDLLGGESGQARVRPVDWSWVEQLQNLQREDLLQELIQKKQVD